MKRPLRKRAKRSGEERHDGDECIAPVSSEEKSFRVFFLSRETDIDPDIARELVDRIERDGDDKRKPLAMTDKPVSNSVVSP